MTVLAEPHAGPAVAGWRAVDPPATEPSLPELALRGLRRSTTHLPVGVAVQTRTGFTATAFASHNALVHPLQAALVVAESAGPGLVSHVAIAVEDPLPLEIKAHLQWVAARHPRAELSLVSPAGLVQQGAVSQWAEVAGRRAVVSWLPPDLHGPAAPKEPAPFLPGLVPVALLPG